MKLSEHFVQNGITINSGTTDKPALIEEMVNLLVEAFDLNHREEILDAVLSRESKMSTGIGCGLAVPHAKVDYVDKMYMVATSVRNGINFEAIDKEPVYLLFLIISPGNTVGPHIRALSSVSRIMADSDVRQLLIAAQTPDDFLRVLREAEDKFL
jgi:PTS system fructose-specific IIC component/PTS system nitrogen regulatory IIA component